MYGSYQCSLSIPPPISFLYIHLSFCYPLPLHIVKVCCHPALCPPSRFGVRPLPKRQMILKLKEIHQYTHQVVSSESEDEAPSLGRPRAVGPPPTTSSMEPTRKPVSCAQTGGFNEPSGRAAPTVSLVKLPGREEDMEPLSASQGSNTSSTAPSEDSERLALGVFLTGVVHVCICLEYFDC